MKNTKEQSKTNLLRHIFPLLISLCSLLICIACQDPSMPSQAENFPPGKGSFSLSVAVAGTARTILPVTPNEFVSYTLDFQPSSGSMARTERVHADLGEPVYLEPGTYKLVVTAYLDSGMTEIAAQGSMNNLVISAGGNTPGNVTLSAIIENGDGVFKYNISFPTIDTAAMKLTPLNAMTGTPEQTLTLNSGAEVTLTLNTGYYNVVITLIKNNGDTLIWREILHIYSNLESVLDMEFSDTDFYKTKYTVTLVLNNDPLGEPASVQHGGMASKPTPDPEKDNYEFSGWYSDPDCTGPQYNFNTLVVSDITLYAKWNIIPVTNITDVPTAATVGMPLTLNGTVVPSNATNKTIAWSVFDAGTTGATISSNTLNATAPGTVTVRATIANGTAQGTDYTRDFTITASLPFVAVTGITDVPTTATAGTPLTLSGTVVPSNATNQIIVWSVQNAGTTSATISGDTLSATAPGTVTVRATIANGTAPGTNYTQDFPITVKGSFTITIDFADMAPSIEGGTIFRNAEKGPQTLPLTVTGSFDSYQWSIDGNIIATTSSFTVSATDPAYNNIGTHSVYLVVYKDGVPYSKTIYFEVKE